MSRWRFWLAQMIWLGTAGFLGMAAASYSYYDSGAGLFAMMAVLIAFVTTGFLFSWGNMPERSDDRGTHMVARAGATVILWVTYLIGVVSVTMQLGAIAILLALILMVPLMGMTALIWMWERITRQGMEPTVGTEVLEKRKRERIDAVLRDLSTDDLQRLRQRLQEGAIQEQHLDMMLDDDGELSWRER